MSFAVAVAAVGVLTGAAAPAQRAAAIPDAGLNVAAASISQARRSLEQAKATGVQAVAFGIGWPGLEPQPDSYKAPGGAGAQAWADLEAQVRYAKQLGLDVVLKLTGAPSWATDPDCTGTLSCPPTRENLARYAEFFADLATRLGPYVDA